MAGIPPSLKLTRLATHEQFWNEVILRARRLQQHLSGGALLQGRQMSRPNSFLNSSVPIVDSVFSDKNFKESGLGVVSVCIIKNLYYIKPTFSRIFLRFSSAIMLAFSVPFFKIPFKCDLSLSNF